jgi:hypothetical protein
MSIGSLQEINTFTDTTAVIRLLNVVWRGGRLKQLKYPVTHPLNKYDFFKREIANLKYFNFD